MKIIRSLGGLTFTIISSIIMILMAIIYFMVIVWIVKIGAKWSGYGNIEGGMVVLTSGIVTAAVMIGSALRQMSS